MQNEKVLVVEDDTEIRELISLYLRKQDYQVLEAENGQQALDLFSLENPSLVVLDVLLPEINGFDVCKRMRNISRVPILFLSSKSDAKDIITGLDAGGDNYLTKPFDPSVLVAKVKAALRRESYGKPDLQLLKFGELEIDLQSYEVRSNGKSITLSSKEFQLLFFLAQSPNQVLSIEQIYNQVWGYSQFGDRRTVMVHMSHLRKKLEPDPSHPRYIITVRGFGYKFQAD